MVFRLLGYSNLYGSCRYGNVDYGDAYYIQGTTPEGENFELLNIRFYKNGNRYCSFNQEAMLRFNVTISRLLDWVRSKEEFAEEAETEVLCETVWAVSDSMKILHSTVLKLTQKAA